MSVYEKSSSEVAAPKAPKKKTKKKVDVVFRQQNNNRLGEAERGPKRGLNNKAVSQHFPGKVGGGFGGCPGKMIG